MPTDWLNAMAYQVVWHGQNFSPQLSQPAGPHRLVDHGSTGLLDTYVPDEGSS
jgi:hypothetical protein